jgi:hypothetical protein
MKSFYFTVDSFIEDTDRNGWKKESPEEVVMKPEASRGYQNSM